MAVAWLPADEYQQALTRWPEFAASDLVVGSDGPLSHAAYCLALQQKLAGFAAAGCPALVLAPVRVARFSAWCAEHGHEPDSASAHAGYAAHLAATNDPALTVWPPGRNEPCWCGSVRKYKTCCEATS